MAGKRRTKRAKAKKSRKPRRTGPTKGRTTRWENLPANLVFDACQEFARGTATEAIAAKISAGLEHRVYRNQVNKVLAEGFRREYLKLAAPTKESLENDASLRFRNPREARDKPKSIKVVVQTYDTSLAYVASAAADTAYDLICKRIARKKKESAGSANEDAGVEPIRVGFGAGSTMMMVAGYLADRLRQTADAPPLHLHSLTAGFRINEPQTAPNSFCNFFHDIPGMAYTGLFTTPYVRTKEWKNLCATAPGVSDSYAEREKIDIIITALAAENDDHGELNRFIKSYGETGEATRQALKKANRVGDVMYRPYGPEAPISLRDELRAATLFELDELVQFAHRPDTAVILVAGPCGARGCPMARDAALLPLLTQKKLDLWTHLVTDDITIRRCIEAVSTPAATTD